MPEIDEQVQEIIVRFTADVSNYIEGSRRIQTEVTAIKDAIHKMSVNSGQDLQILAKSIRETLEAQVKIASQKLKAIPKIPIAKEG